MPVTTPEALAETVPMPAPNLVPAMTYAVEQPSPWTSMLVGVGLGIVTLGLGAIIVYLIVRPREPSRQLGDAAQPRALPAAPAQVYVINTGGQPAQVLRAEPVAPSPDDAAFAVLDRLETKMSTLLHQGAAPATAAPAPLRTTPSTMRTYQLPWLADPQAPAIRVATAGTEPYAVTVRVVSPPGALAALSLSANELNIQQPVIAANMSAVPTGDTLIIPAGSKQTILMNPRDILYARGNFANANPNGAVVVSITASDYRQS